LSEERILELRRAGWKKGEASRERFRNTMRQKRQQRAQEIYALKKEEFSALPKEAEYIAGLMLYLAEGAKRAKYDIQLANTDPDIIKFFARWLTDYLRISKETLHFQLHLYEGMDIEKEENFWQNTLGTPKSQFYKTQIRPLRAGSFSYRESFRHGTCQIRYNDGLRKMELMTAIKAFMDVSLSEDNARVAQW
jgi:hypothetical protein